MPSKIFNRILFKYSLAAVLITVPLYPKFPLISIPGTYVSIRLEDILIAVISTILLFVLISKKTSRIPGETIGRQILIYLCIGLLSLASAILITHSIVPHIGILHWLRRIEYVSVFFVAAFFLKDEKDVPFFYEVLFWVVLTVTLYGFGQRFLGFPVISTQNQEFAKGLVLTLTPGARLNSTFAGHYDLAAFSVLIIPVFISLWLAPLSRRYKFMGLAGFFLSYWLLLASASRISFPSYLLSSSLTLFLLNRKKTIPILLIFSFLTVSGSSELTARYTRTANIYLSRLFPQVNLSLLNKLTAYLKKPGKSPTEPAYQLPIITPPPVSIPTSTAISPPSPTPTVFKKAKVKIRHAPTPYQAPVIIEERSTEIRLNAEWPRAIRAFKKNPFLGTGFSSITLATDNDYLRMLGETGILGTLSFLLIFMAIFKSSMRILNFDSSSPRRIFAIGLTGSAVGLLINSTFIDVMEASKVAIPFWLLMGILASLTNVSVKANK